MRLYNDMAPKYYAEFRQKVMDDIIPINYEISLEMLRIEKLIEDPNIYYYPEGVECFIDYCENELVLSNGDPLIMLDSFKLWGEQLFGWFEATIHTEYVKDDYGKVHARKVRRYKRLVNKQYIITARGSAKSAYGSCVQSLFLNVDPSSTQQICVSPTMRQSEEILNPIKTAIVKKQGPLTKFLTHGKTTNRNSTVGINPQLVSTRKGIENKISNSVIEVKAMSIAKLQGYKPKVTVIDEWLSVDNREDVVGAIEQGATKNTDDYLIIAISSEGTVRSGTGDEIKMELGKILRGEYENNHISIFHYKIDDLEEVNDPNMWIKANPNIGITISYETYAEDVKRMENVPSTRNDILAKRFGWPMEGFTYFFKYEETLPSAEFSLENVPCALGIDLSHGDDFTAFTFLSPSRSGYFYIKTRCYISEKTYNSLSPNFRTKYDEFIEEDSLIVMPGIAFTMSEIFEDLDDYIQKNKLDVITVGYDPYNSTEFMDRYIYINGSHNIEVVRQGVKTESVPLGELKNYANERALLFDQSLFSFCMGNAIALEDTNGNRKLSKKRRDQKIDAVSALLDAYVAYKLHIDDF